MWQKQFRHAYGASVKAALHNSHLVFPLVSCEELRESLWGTETGPARTVVLALPESD